MRLSPNQVMIEIKIPKHKDQWILLENDNTRPGGSPSILSFPCLFLLAAYNVKAITLLYGSFMTI